MTELDFMKERTRLINQLNAAIAQTHGHRSISSRLLGVASKLLEHSPHATAKVIADCKEALERLVQECDKLHQPGSDAFCAKINDQIKVLDELREKANDQFGSLNYLYEREVKVASSEQNHLGYGRRRLVGRLLAGGFGRTHSPLVAKMMKAPPSSTPIRRRSTRSVIGSGERRRHPLRRMASRRPPAFASCGRCRRRSRNASRRMRRGHTEDA